MEDKDFLKTEYMRVKNAIENLSKIVDKMNKGTLSFTPKQNCEHMNMRLEYMKRYKGVLEKRASEEGIIL